VCPPNSPVDPEIQLTTEFGDWCRNVFRPLLYKTPPWHQRLDAAHHWHMVFEKSSPPPKLFRRFSLRLSLFASNYANFWQFISAYIYRFMYIYLNISPNGVNFSTSIHRFHAVKFWVFTQKTKCSVPACRKLRYFFVIACFSVRSVCKQFVTV